MQPDSRFWSAAAEVAERSAALAALVVASPALAVIAAAIKLQDGGPVLFRQRRVGKQGALFTILKFRTMRVAAEGPAVTAAGDARITSLGAFLRAFKLDEIPQLWNVVRGDMRLIGPRPEAPRYVDCSDSRWQTVLSVKPGITDLATLMFRDEETLLAAAGQPEQYYRQSVLPQKLDLNCEYLAARSPLSDLRLLILTVVYSLRPQRVAGDRVRRLVLSRRAS